MQLGRSGMRFLCLALVFLAGEAAKLGHVQNEGDVISKLSSLAAADPAIADLSTLTMQSVLFATTQPLKVETAESSLQKVETLLISLARNTSTSTNMSEAAQIISDACEMMKASIQSQLSRRQDQLDQELDGIVTCKDALYWRHVDAKKLNESLPDLNATHRICRKNESFARGILDDCERILSGYQDEYHAVKRYCDYYEFQSPNQSQELCDNRDGSAGIHYKNLWDYWANYITWYDGNMSLCIHWKQKIDEMAKNCSTLQTGHQRKRVECNSRQNLFDTDSCNIVQESEKGCEAYSRCYDSAFNLFVSVNTTSSDEEKVSKQVWGAVLRIECLLPVLLDSKNKEALIEECIGKTHNLDEISLNYSSSAHFANETAPYDAICRNLTEYVPGTIAHFQHFFLGLPPDAPVTTKHALFCPSTSEGLRVESQALPWICGLSTTFKPNNSQTSASSATILDYTPGLDGPTAWSPFKAERGQYLEVDMGKNESVGGVLVQGGSINGSCENSWVTSFSMTHSLDGKVYSYLPQNPLRGSFDCSTEVGVAFPHHFNARYVRFAPQTWHGASSMRVGLLLC